MQVVPNLELGSEFGVVATAALSASNDSSAGSRVEGALGARTVGDAAVGFHSLTEGLATVELRGEMLDTTNASACGRLTVPLSIIRGWSCA